jgi:hypothetical protein
MLLLLFERVPLAGDGTTRSWVEIRFWGDGTTRSWVEIRFVGEWESTTCVAVQRVRGRTPCVSECTICIYFLRIMLVPKCEVCEGCWCPSAKGVEDTECEVCSGAQWLFKTIERWMLHMRSLRMLEDVCRPTVEALAAASLDDVNSCWAGLGYVHVPSHLVLGWARGTYTCHRI